MIQGRISMIDGVGLGVIVALSAGVYYGVIAPASMNSADIAEDRARLAEIDEALVKAENQRREVELQVARHDELIRQRKITLEPLSALNERIAAITSLSASCGVGIAEIRAGKPISMGAVLGVPVQLAGNAGYDAVTSFARTLHERFPDVAIQSLELVGTPAEPTSVPTFRAELIWRAAAAGAGAGPAGSAGANPGSPR